MKQQITIEIICFLLILLFVYAALNKLFDYSSFQQQITKAPFISSFSKVAWMLPAAELIVSLLLTIQITRIIGLIISLFLLLGFTTFIIFMVATEKHLPCSCGGVLKQLTWKQHILFNAFFLCISIIGIFIKRKQARSKNFVI